MVAIREASAEGLPEVQLPSAVVGGPTLLDIWRGPAVPDGPEPAPEPEPEALATRLSDALDGWRAAERALGDHRGGSRENAVLEAEVGAWRAAYQRIFTERRARQDGLRADDPRSGSI